MLEHLGGDDSVELAVSERQGQRIALSGVRLGAHRHLAGLLHRAEPLADDPQLVGVLVEGGDVGAALVHLEGVAASATTHVEHPVTRSQAQAVEINGQH